LALLGTPLSYFLNPPGCDWGRVMFTNAASSRAFDIEPCPGGFIIAGEVSEAGGLYDTALLAILDANGSVVRSNMFPGVIETGFGQLGSGAYAVIVSHGTDGHPDGFVFAGYRHLRFTGTISDPRPEWINPALWVVKTDLLLQVSWETNLSRGVFEYGPGLARWGTDLVQTPEGYLIAGRDYADYLINPQDQAATEELSTGGCLLHLDRNGTVLEVRQSQQTGAGWLATGPASVAESSDGGYVLGAGNALIKLNSSRVPVWTNALPVRTYGAIERSAGSYALLGRQRMDTIVPSWENLLLAGIDSGGGLQWTNIFGRVSAGDIGRELVEIPSGLVIAGQTDSMGAGAADMWVVKTDSNGNRVWETAIGGSEADTAYALALTDDGKYLVLGQASVDATNHWIWLAKLRSALHTPTASFVCNPASPVFTGKTVTFDASTSSNPGAAIAAYNWKFGDGTNASGMSVQHIYAVPGTYDVTLEVISSDGPRTWATQAVEVTGLVMQWQRIFGKHHFSELTSIVASQDGGFVLAGGSGGVNINEFHLWIIKTDRRGKVVWEKFYDDAANGEEKAWGLVRGTDGGYVMVGSTEWRILFTTWYEMLLAKVDEEGELVWPLTRIGITNRYETGKSIVAAPDGGYTLLGSAQVGGPYFPWVTKVDASGTVQWDRVYEMDSTHRGQWITSISDGGYVFTSKYDYGDAIVKIDSLGLPIWTNITGSHDDLNWIGERKPPQPGLVAGGRATLKMLLRFYDNLGGSPVSKRWTGLPDHDGCEGEYVAPAPDGGYLLIGTVLWKGTPTRYYDEAAIVKTDAEGNEQWVQFVPGTTNRDEYGVAGVALEDGCVVLGRLGLLDQGTEWLFKLSANRTPTAVMTITPPVIPAGEPVSFSGLGSTDRENSIPAYEWNFGDGHSGVGSTPTHVFTNAGLFTVRMTAIDQDDGESSVSNTVTVTGVRIMNTSGIEVTESSITNNAMNDPVHYPVAGVPGLLDQSCVRGFRLVTHATSSTTRKIRITFSEPVPSGLKLYQLPAWTQRTYSAIDSFTIEISLSINSGDTTLTFMLGRVVARPAIGSVRLTPSARLAFSFQTETNFTYNLVRASQLAPAAIWEIALCARTSDGPSDIEFLPGTGAVETIYTDCTGGGFYRIAIRQE
jgi:PKD repeat protein